MYHIHGHLHANSTYNYCIDVVRSRYPDGVENEQTSTYHLVALHSFDHFVNTVRQIPSLDEHLLHATNHIRDAVERMWNYTAYVSSVRAHSVQGCSARRCELVAHNGLSRSLVSYLIDTMDGT